MFKLKSLSAVFFLFLALILTGCPQEITPGPPPPGPNPLLSDKNRTVFWGGWITKDVTSDAESKFYDNRFLYSTDTSHDEDNYAGTSKVFDTFADASGDIYSCGQYGNKACYWKPNGERVLLPDNNVGVPGDNVAVSMFVEKNGSTSTVYTTGWVLVSGKEYRCIVWENDSVKFNGANGAPRLSSEGRGIVKIGADIIVSGTYTVNVDEWSACYWNFSQSATPVDLPGSVRGSTYKMMQYKNKLYIAGGYYGPADRYYACYWKIDKYDTAPVVLKYDLESGDYGKYDAAFSMDIKVSSTDPNDITLYFCGITEDRAVYWVNSKMYLIQGGLPGSMAMDIKAYEGDIYVGGSFYNINKKLSDGYIWKISGNKTNQFVSNDTYFPGNTVIWSMEVVPKKEKAVQ